jgi:hypothetical protein
MKTVPLVTSVVAALTLALLPAKAGTPVTYLGTGVADGTIADGDGFNSVVVNNDASTISFTINTSANMASYIFYAIEIQQVGQGGSGSTSLVNPWGPHVGISTGVNDLINTYGTGATPLTYSGSWVAGSSVSYTAGGTGNNFATIVLPLSDFGLSAGNSFYFDVVSSYTGGTSGQAAYGALDNSGYLPESDNSYQPYTGANYYDSATSAGSGFGTAATMYTVQPIPEPATCAGLGLGTLLMIMRRRARSAR